MIAVSPNIRHRMSVEAGLVSQLLFVSPDAAREVMRWAPGFNPSVHVVGVIPRKLIAAAWVEADTGIAWIELDPDPDGSKFVDLVRRAAAVGISFGDLETAGELRPLHFGPDSWRDHVISLSGLHFETAAAYVDRSHSSPWLIRCPARELLNLHRTGEDHA